MWVEGGTYWWVGEGNKTRGDLSLGIELYSSTDLVTWAHFGMILTGEQMKCAAASPPYR